MTQTKFPCTLFTSPDKSSRKTFNNRSELKNFIRDQASSWNQLDSDSFGDLRMSEAVRTMRGVLDDTDLKTRLDSNGNDDAFIIARAQDILTNTQVVITDSGRGLVVRKFLDEGKHTEAAIAFSYFQHTIDLKRMNHHHFVGVIHAVMAEMIDAGLTPTRQKEFDELFQQGKDKLVGIENTYKEFMTLKGPSDYWGSVRKKYRIATFVLAVLILVAIVLSGHGLYVALSWIEQYLQRPPGKFSDIFYYRLTVVGLISAFVFWGLRFLSRLFMSAAHMEADASERIAIIQSYLAMINHDSTAKALDRSILLSAICRTSSTGLVSSDSNASQSFDVNIDKLIPGK